MSEDPVVRCERCGRLGGTVAYGWHILCKRCKNNDQAEFEDRI